MVGSKQNKKFWDIEGLTDAELKILKVLAVWPFSTVHANFFNIAKKAGVNDSYVSRCLRRLHSRGIVYKSVAGAWHVSVLIEANILNEARKKEPQNVLPEVEQP